MSLPDPKYAVSTVEMMRSLDDTSIIELVCAADKVWGERYGDDRTRVPRCSCCHTNEFRAGMFVGEICQKCQHSTLVHGPK